MDDDVEWATSQHDAVILVKDHISAELRRFVRRMALSPLNVEIKVRYSRTDKTAQVISSLNAEFQGVNHQVDTYFKVPSGRLKLRQQDLSHDYLVFYDREDTTTPKESNYLVASVHDVIGVLNVLGAALGVRTVVRKKREFWLWQNVRIFLDEVEQLGSFLEFEVVCENEIEIDEAYSKIKYLMQLFGIRDKDLVAVSYSDMQSSG